MHHPWYVADTQHFALNNVVCFILVVAVKVEQFALTHNSFLGNTASCARFIDCRFFHHISNRTFTVKHLNCGALIKPSTKVTTTRMIP